MYIILLRKDKYLTERYQWGNLPALFPMWRAKALTRLMFGPKIKQKPTGWAVVEDAKVIDLDTLEVTPF